MASDVQAKEVAWLWRNRFPLGMLSIIAGKPGGGKTFALCEFAATISTGRDWADREHCQRGNVLIMSGEDSPEYTLRPRLDALGADTNKIYFASLKIDTQETLSLVDFNRDLNLLAQLLDELNPHAVFIDALSCFTGSADQNNSSDMRSVLTRLAALAQHSGAAIICIMHLRKSGAIRAGDAIAGSHVIEAQARSVYLMSNDKDDKERRLFVPCKCNLCQLPSGLAWRLNNGKVVWEDAPLLISAEDAIAESGNASQPSGAQQNAEEFLRELLADGGAVSATELNEQAVGSGISQRTLRRAQKLLQGSGVIEKFKCANRWHWRYNKKVNLFSGNA